MLATQRVNPAECVRRATLIEVAVIVSGVGFLNSVLSCVYWILDVSSVKVIGYVHPTVHDSGFCVRS